MILPEHVRCVLYMGRKCSLIQIVRTVGLCLVLTSCRTCRYSFFELSILVCAVQGKAMSLFDKSTAPGRRISRSMSSSGQKWHLSMELCVLGELHRRVSIALARAFGW